MCSDIKYEVVSVQAPTNPTWHHYLNEKDIGSAGSHLAQGIQTSTSAPCQKNVLTCDTDLVPM